MKWGLWVRSVWGKQENQCDVEVSREAMGESVGQGSAGAVVRHWEEPWGDESFCGVCVLGGTWRVGRGSRGSPLTPLHPQAAARALCRGAVGARPGCGRGSAGPGGT